MAVNESQIIDVNCLNATVDAMEGRQDAKISTGGGSYSMSQTAHSL